MELLDPMDPDKLARFKERIGFDERPRGRGVEPAVPAPWPDPLAAPGVAGGGWSLAADTTWREGEGSAREWVLRRGREALMVLGFQADAGEEGARDFFLARTCNTMTLEVPFEPGPPDLGSLSARSPHAESPYLIWVAGSRCVELKAVDTGLDLLAIAHWLQAALAAVPRAGGEPPPPDVLRLSALRAPVGQERTLHLEPGSPEAGADYRMELEYDRGRIEVLALEGLTARLVGRRPGRASLTVHGIDPATLAGSSHTVDLNFLPPGEA